MHLYKTITGAILHHDNKHYRLPGDFDSILNQENLYHWLSSSLSSFTEIDSSETEKIIESDLLPPIGTQEVWAAGVTYLRSRDARMEESQDSGAADCYQRVYEAERPEIFFKSVAHRVCGHNQEVFIRSDSDWNVPEPELTLYINSSGNIQGYTIGNDMSSRSIEGENPLYLPQAKVYEKSAAIGPCLFIPEGPISRDTTISLTIHRDNTEMFVASTTIDRMKRGLDELAAYLYRCLAFPVGAYLMTGTCLVPPNDFTLAAGDIVTIKIAGIGVMRNTIGVL